MLALHLRLIRDTTIISCPFPPLPCTLRVIPWDTVTPGDHWALWYLPSIRNLSVEGGQGVPQNILRSLLLLPHAQHNPDPPVGMRWGVSHPQLILLVREDAKPCDLCAALAPGFLGYYSSSFTA